MGNIINNIMDNMDKKLFHAILVLFIFVLIIPIAFPEPSYLQIYEKNGKPIFYTGGHPGKWQYPTCNYKILMENIKYLKKLGVNKIIVLGPECIIPKKPGALIKGSKKNYLQILKENGFDVIFIDLGKVIIYGNKNYDAQIEAAYKWLDNAKGDVYVHCWNGMHRTGAFVARWLNMNNLEDLKKEHCGRIMRDLMRLDRVKNSILCQKWALEIQPQALEEPELKITEYNGKLGYILKVDPEKYDIRILSAESLVGKTRATVAEMVKKSGAIAGINGSFYNTNRAPDCSKPTKFGVPLGLTIENKIQKSEYLGNGEWDCHLMNPPNFPNHFLVINNNIPEILSYNEYISKYSEEYPDYALQSAALKYKNTKRCDLGSAYCSNEKHSATYACITYDNNLLLAVYQQAGVTYPKDFNLQCKSIINLDGGGSSTLVIPSKCIEYFGDIDQQGSSPREVPNAILIFKKGAPIPELKKVEPKETKAVKKSFCGIDSVEAHILCQIEKMMLVFFSK